MRYYDYETAITNHWLRSGIGPREAAAELQHACVDVEVDEETIRKLEATWQEKHDPILIIYGLLGEAWKRLAGFDCEDVHMPADHTDVVGYLAAATSSKFSVQDVTQAVEPNGNLNLSLTHAGKVYAFTFEDNGSWLNVAGLLAGLNSILEEIDITERFIELYAGEGPGVAVFAVPDKFLPAASKLGIRLGISSSPESAG